MDEDFEILGIPEDDSIKYSPKIESYRFSNYTYKPKEIEIDPSPTKKENNIIIEVNDKHRRNRKPGGTPSLF